MIAYRAHDRILRKAVALDSAAAVFRVGFAGPNYLDAANRPNWQLDTWALSARDQLSDFTAQEWSNDGGCPAQAVRNLVGYGRTVVVPLVDRGAYGSALSTPGQRWANRVAWAPHGDWQPDDWASTHTDGEVFHPPWGYLDCSPVEQIHGYPWCEPAVAPAWWKSTTGFAASPQNPWNVDCPECALLGLKRMGGYPVGVVYVTIQYAGLAEEIFGAALIHGPAYWRAGGGLSTRYQCRLGPGYCSGDYAYWLAKLLAEGGASPWSEVRYAALSTAADQVRVQETIPLADVELAFPELLTTAWTFTAYAAPVWTPPNAPPAPPNAPEVLPHADLVVTQSWTNHTTASVAVRSIGIVGHHSTRNQWELLFWGPLDAAASVAPDAAWRPDAVRFRLTDLGGN